MAGYQCQEITYPEVTISHIKKASSITCILSTVTWTKFESNFTDIITLILHTDLFRQADYLTQFEILQAKVNYLAQRPGQIENFSQGGSRYRLTVPHRGVWGHPSPGKLLKNATSGILRPSQQVIILCLIF